MLLAPLILFTIAFVCGELFCHLFRHKSTVMETSIIGTCFIFLTWEFFCVIAMVLDLDFSVLVRLYSVFLCAVFLATFIMFGKDIHDSHHINEAPSLKGALGILAILLIQIAFIFVIYPDHTFDFTVEMINTTLASNHIYLNHPGTGEAFSLGMKTGGKIVTLPLFYSLINKISGGSPLVLVYKIVPVWTLLLSYCSYSLLAKGLFEGRKAEKGKVLFFLVALGVLNLLGTLSSGSIFYYQLYRGFRGETICYSVLLPYTLYLMHRILVKEEWKSIFFLVMVLFSSLALCWYSTGFVPLTISVLICLIVYTGYRIKRRVRCSL